MRAAALRAVSVILAAVLAIPSAAASVRSGSFTLRAERGSYLLGEPIYLRIESGNSPVPSLEEGTLFLAILGSGEPERIYHPPLRLRTAALGNRPRPKASGERVRFARIICADGQLVFRTPGRYRLRLVSIPAGRSALSDSLTVVFTAPVNPADKKAYALLSRNPGEYGLAVYLEGGDQLKQGMAILGELAAFESAYARLASFVLSSDWSQDFTDYRGSGSRPLDLQKALAWAQWDKSRGAYIPLRNAYRLKTGADIQAARTPSAPGLEAVRGKLAVFLASLTPEEKAWFRSFSPGSGPVPSPPSGFPR
jgi:hypothetical protein